MAGKSRFAIAEKAIRNFFEKGQEKVFGPEQLAGIHEERRVEWNLAQSSTPERFLDQLLKKKVLSKLELSFEGSYERARLYAAQGATVYQVALALHSKAYLSHYSAMLSQRLTEQVPKAVYITFERSKPQLKQSKPQLEQHNVDAAFSKPQKLTASAASYDGHRIYILNGQYTHQLGVYTEDGLRLTNLERTLIDITVRPAYSGGVAEVLKAYRAARERLSLNKLLATLKRLDYIYPYHQAIGFYLEKAGYTSAQLEPFRALGLHIDFYLTYDMQSMAYSKEWRLYYPEGM